MENPEMKIIPVKSFVDSFQAHLAKGKLESEGIECFLANENISNLSPGYLSRQDITIDLMVSEYDYERAFALLTDSPIQNASLDFCPKCRSANIKRNYGKSKIRILIAFMLSLITFVPFIQIKYNLICKDCKYEFVEPRN
ncbi:MAG: DUF2007 domain-containing protein [Bacteroidetes bacterium]|nr:DUF2007 domain-containing protein [Bacteroidota bacterium]